MATTILPRDLDTGPARAPQHPPPTRTTVAWLGWVLVAVSLVLTTVLAVRALGSDREAPPVPWFSVERGSIAAIDHASEQQARNRPFSVETGSIAALDHTAEAPLPGFSVEHGSITAIDHAAAEAPGDG